MKQIGKRMHKKHENANTLILRLFIIQQFCLELLNLFFKLFTQFLFIPNIFRGACTSL